jgi:phosphatidylinositol-3-phosphatase
VLATVCAAMGLSPCPGAAETAAAMSDFFIDPTAPNPPTNSVIVSSPGNGSTIIGAVNLMAYASENQPVSQTQVWDNGTRLGWYSGTEVHAIYNLAPGKHTITVLDETPAFRVIHQSSVTCTVQPPGGRRADHCPRSD